MQVICLLVQLSPKTSMTQARAGDNMRKTPETQARAGDKSCVTEPKKVTKTSETQAKASDKFFSCI